MRHINAADLCRQIRREGRRLGLVPHLDADGVVHAAQLEPRYSGRGILATSKEATPVCSVDMDHPISRVGKFRKARWDRDRLRRLREAQQRRREAAQKEANDRWAAYRGDLEKGARQLGADEFLRAMREVLNGGLDGR